MKYKTNFELNDIKIEIISLYDDNLFLLIIGLCFQFGTTNFCNQSLLKILNASLSKSPGLNFVQLFKYQTYYFHLRK